MKTTLNLKDEILKNAKQRAAEKGITLTRFVEQALQAQLLEPSKTSEYVYKPVIVRGTAPPNVDVADRSALYDFMESDDDRGRY